MLKRNFEIIGSAVRSITLVVASSVAAKGYIQQSDVLILASAVPIVAAASWGIICAMFNEIKASRREALALHAGIVAASSGERRISGITPETAPALIAKFNQPETKP